MQPNTVGTKLDISVILPVYNEQATLEHQVLALLRGLDDLPIQYELLAVENGSHDQSLAILVALARHHPQLRVHTLPEANFGGALRLGMERGRGDVLVVFNVDLWDLDFLERGLPLLADHDLVIASKLLARSADQRPLLRRVLSRGFNFILRHLFGFRGSDTHGMKLLARERVLPVVERCRLDKGLFDTELVLRAQRRGLRVAEVPSHVTEIRVPRDAMSKKVLRVAGNLWRLKLALLRDDPFPARPEREARAP